MYKFKMDDVQDKLQFVGPTAFMESIGMEINNFMKIEKE